MNYKNVKIDKTAKIAKQSVIIGDVTIGCDSCVLYYSVIRGDDAPIVIGEETNIRKTAQSMLAATCQCTLEIMSQ